VNGSPTKTQMADGAGGRSQLAQLTASAVVLVTLLLLTGLLADLPVAALAAVVFLIGVQLVDVPGMRRVLSARRDEFIVALLTAAAVVALGVQDGIILAIAASVIDHLRHSYRPLSSVLVKSPAGHWESVPVAPGARTEPGLVVYRFGTGLYYANASRLVADITALTSAGRPLRWLVLDAAAIGDIDYTAASVLGRAIKQLHARQIRLVLTSLLAPVRQQLDRYGLSGTAGPDAYYDSPGEALEAYHAAVSTSDSASDSPDPPPAPDPG
jgi:MFS superfamily sulfate permease-like transporter